MSELYPSHDGNLVPVDRMANPHLERALTKLEGQEHCLVLILTGLDPDGAKSFRKAMAPWAPAFTAEEMLGRTRHWVAVLKAEKARREKESWQGLLE